MKFIPSHRTLITIFVLGVLFSPVVNVFVPESYNSQFISFSQSIDNTSDNSQQIAETWKDHPKPNQVSIDYFDDETSKIISFTSFDARDTALKVLPPESINIIYDFIPSIAVSDVELSDFDLRDVRSVTPDMKLQKMAESSDEVVLADQLLVDGHTLAETGEMIGTNYLKEVYGLSGEGTKIAVLDTGVNGSLATFSGKVTNDVVSDLAPKGNLDQDGHGTHVTGIISSNGLYNLNGDLVQTDSEGVAPGAEILSIRVLDEQGIGDNSWIIEGIGKAVSAEVDIISLSLSTVIYEGENDAMQLAVNAALEKGIMVIAAAGNTGPVGSGIGIPGALDGVIAVGATFPFSTTDWEIWTFSGIGPSINSSGPDLVAPGANILSIDASDGTLEKLSGTSMSTPHVAGGIALLREAYPNANPTQIREALLASSQIIFNSNGFLEQVEAQGRGQVRFDIAHLILNETLVNNPNTHTQPVLFPNIVQDRNYIYHHRTIGENKTLPFYIYSSRAMNVTGVINNEKTDGVNFYFQENITLVEGKNVIEITLEVTKPKVGVATGQMYFVESETLNMLPNAVIFYDTLTRYREANILFDTAHDGDTPSAYFGNHGPNGQLSQMAKSLAFVGQNITTSGNQTITPELLSNYDMLIIANPDRDYTTAEIQAIRSFVREDGKSLFVIVSGGLLAAEGEPTYAQFNRADLNAILQETGIYIPEDQTTPFSTRVCNYEALNYDQRTEDCLDPGVFLRSQSIFEYGLRYPHFGPQLGIQSSSADTTELAYANGQLVAASAEFSTQGRVMVFSSQLPFDNVGILYDYLGPHTAQSNEGILHTSIDWLLEPNQAKMVSEVNGQIGTEFDIDMYDRVLIKLSPFDKDGNLLSLGDTIDITVQEEGIDLQFVNIDGSYFIEFPDGFVRNVERNFFFHLTPEGSIPSDSHFSLYIQLKNFENQDMFRGISLMILMVFVTSWIFWIKNEGGRKAWELRKNQDQDA